MNPLAHTLLRGMILAAFLCAGTASPDVVRDVVAKPGPDALGDDREDGEDSDRDRTDRRGPLNTWFDSSLPAPTLAVDEVIAGRAVELTWRPLGRVAKELEIVLSIDDGKHYDIRVTHELAGDASSYVWHVPNIGVERVRVRLRARISGREVNGPASQPFRLVVNPVAPPGRWSFRAGEWWEDAAGEPFTMPSLATPGSGPSFRDGRAPATASGPERAPVLATPTRSASVVHSRPCTYPLAAAPADLSIPGYLPLRE